MSKADKVRQIHLPPDGTAGAGARHDYAAPGKKSYDLQKLLQRFPRLYACIKAVLSPTMPTRTWKSWIPNPADHVVVNLGAGTTCLHPEMIHVDFVAFPHIDIVADFSEPLPIRSDSVDAVLSISVFEHLPRAEFVAGEVCRILKPGGVFYLATPFQYPFHGAPQDYTRWTLPGLEALLGDQFELTSSGSRGGPMGVVSLAIAHAAAQLGCFGSEFLYSTINFAALGLLSPLKLLDLLFGFLPFNTQLCTGYFVAARKKNAAGQIMPQGPPRPETTRRELKKSA